MAPIMKLVRETSLGLQIKTDEAKVVDDVFMIAALSAAQGVQFSQEFSLYSFRFPDCSFARVYVQILAPSRRKNSTCAKLPKKRIALSFSRLGFCAVETELSLSLVSVKVFTFQRHIGI